MKEQYYIKLNEFKTNDFNYGSLLIIEGKPFSYDIGHMIGKREEVLNYVTKRTIQRTELENVSFIFKYETLDDVKIMRKHLQEDPFFDHREIEMVPAVFASDYENNELIDNLLKKHSLERRMFDLHDYENN